MRIAVRLSLALGVAFGFACSEQRSRSVPTPASASTFVSSPAPESLPPAGGEITVVTDPDALAYLDAHGFSFAERFADRKSARYASLLEFLGHDIDAALARYAKERPSIGTAHKTAREINDRFAALNRDWFTSEATHFELVGVVNRFDRRIFQPRRATCGEIRLVYRAAYRGPRESSRLPVTVMVVFPQVSSDCGTVARAWIDKSGIKPRGLALAHFLEKGPLRALAKPMAFELNALVESWSRFVQEADGVGAHHRYSLRVFRPDGDRLVAEPLDNTPDVDAVVASPEKKAALQQWIVANAAAIERGTAFLGPLPSVGDVRATQVSSFTAMGLTRAANRPYSRIFMDDVGSLRTALGHTNDGDTRALLRKLDMTTCNGCHVTRSVLGLHLPGDERDAAAYLDPAAFENDPGLVVDGDRPAGLPRDSTGAARKTAPIDARVTANRLAVGISPHVRDEIDRRTRDLRRFLHDGGFEPMPPPDRGATLQGGYAAPCAVGPSALVGSDTTALACGGGLRCVALDDSGYGQCIGAYGAGDLRSVGDPFELQRYTVGPKWATADFTIDRGPVVRVLPCMGGGPTGRDRGFPFGGICAPTVQELVVDRIDHGASTGCPATDGIVPLGESGWLTTSGTVVTTPSPGAREVVCGLQPFRAAKTWGYMSTAAMVWNSTAPGFQPACDLDHPCRDEYVCMRRLPRANHALRDPFAGTCMAGYVLAQLELDAHKVP